MTPRTGPAPTLRRPRPRRAARLRVAAAIATGATGAIGAWAGCVGPEPAAPPRVVPAGWRLQYEDGVRPTLAEIFLDAPPFGEPPEILGASADARYAVIAWTDPALADDAAQRARLRLVGADERRQPTVGRPLADLLPPAGPDEPHELRWAWSGAGHRFALARGTAVWTVDPALEIATPFARWDAPAAPAAPVDGLDAEPGEASSTEATVEPPHADQEDGPPPQEAGDGNGTDDDEPSWEPSDEPPPVLALGPVTSLAFRAGDAPPGLDVALRIGDGDELVELPLDPRPDGAVRGLDDALWLSRDVDAPAGRLTWSDDGRVAFGQDPLPRPERAPGNQVWIVGEEREVELEGWDAGGTLERVALSPDGRWLVAIESDDSAGPEPVEIPNYLSPRVTHAKGRSRLADDRHEPVRVWAWNVWTGAREELAFGPPLAVDPPPADALGELPSGATPAPLDAGDAGPGAPRDHVWTVGWSRPAEGPPAFALERHSEDHRTLEVWTWHAGEMVRRHVERDPRWIGGPARRTRWEPGGAALYIGSEVAAGSTTPGRCQIFRLHLASGELRQVTTVAGEVKDFRPLEGGGLLVVASGNDPARTECLHYDRDAARGIPGTKPRRYPLPAGVASDPHAADDGARLFALREELLRPAEVWAAELAGDAHAVTDAVPAGYAELALEPPHKLAVVDHDGTAIHAHAYLPPGVSLDDAGPPRATIVFIHGAGYLQNVTDSMTRYPLNALFHVRLARMGYLVLDVDYRGSAGYGGAFRTDAQYHLGGRDLDDVHAVVDALIARGLVDQLRVGVYGGSYGGFLTMMALFTAPERWAVGCALRSVTDWRTYHAGYIVPRLGRPSTHPGAYARSCPIDLVDGLADPLLVLHGMMDSNVLAQDSIRLIEALIDRGKEFDAMLYPSQSHAFEDGEHWLDEYRRIERYLIEHLGPPLAFPAGAGPWPHAVWMDGCYYPYPWGPLDPGSRDGGPIDAGPWGSPTGHEAGGGVRALGHGLRTAGSFLYPMHDDDDDDPERDGDHDDGERGAAALRTRADADDPAAVVRRRD
jgi:dipeptidyl aminopeptidase/acylaminoacyl peptidase